MPIYSSRSLKKLFQKLHFIPEKKFGQIFIINYQVCKRAVDALNLFPNQDRVLEVGPGFGAFSDLLLNKSRTIFLIDRDPKCISYLYSHFSLLSHKILDISIFKHDLRNISFLGSIPEKAKVNLIQGDFLSIPFPKVNKLISNVPFGISIPFILRCIREQPLDLYVLIVQREFQQHLCAQPGQSHYTFISALANVYFDIEILEDIPKSAYYPLPDVPTVLLRLSPKENFNPESNYYANRSLFIEFLRTLFFCKKKLLRNIAKSISMKNSSFLLRFPLFTEISLQSEFSDVPIFQIPPKELFALMETSMK
ncbi:MAG: rRNA adenine N(6)-methyltransferase family protein [Candidatus Lokiarchaeota archaeon]|nr:rRNA adenine N(6)-methyltransferase family protein [Candidatus Harpocratesius repetitus]